MRLRTRFALFAVGTAATAALLLAPVDTSARNPFRQKTSVEQLAEKIDRLEKNVETYGTIVAKTPDVWGESRLTKHRRDFEAVVKEELTKYADTINASIARSDSAFLASALALESAAAGGQSGTSSAPQANASTLVSNFPATDVFARTSPLALLKNSDFAAINEKGKGVALEPVVHLDQLSRYLQHLNEIRRVNEGDDTSDSPGYALHLVRIPVSVLPGEKTREGYGAEITITAEPYLSGETLPMTFRTLVINDLADHLTMPMTTFVQHLSDVQHLSEHAPEAQQDPKLKEKIKSFQFELRNSVGLDDQRPKYAPESLINAAEALRPTFFDATTPWEGNAKPVFAIPNPSRVSNPFPVAWMPDIYGLETLSIIANGLLAPTKAPPIADTTRKVLNPLDCREFLGQELQAAYVLLSLPENLDLWSAVDGLADAIKRHDQKTVLLYRMTFSKLLHDKVEQATIDRSTDPVNQEIGTSSPNSPPKTKPISLDKTVTGALAWTIIVESALLNERLVEDIKRTASIKNAPALVADPLPFYLPNPPDEAKFAFNEYVRCRWPIHVMAIDPVTQDQNVADAFSRRREMQLALSLAFASGRVGAQSFQRFARRIELDMESIDLNRTIVGFSHGDDTFGWRFYPRVQSPDIPSNLQVIFYEQLIGGPSRDHDMRKRRLEPGIRECVALVIMPEFVPYVMLDTRCNWFKLTDPTKRQLNLEDHSEISKDIQSMRDLCAMCVEDQDQYRDGEVHRLERAVKQLECRLPLQTSYVQMPYDCTSGGFAMLATGASPLAPHLDGYYGEPGVAANGATNIYVIGNNFSVHETTAIAGNASANVQIISRRIIQVTIPENAQKMERTSGDAFVDVHVATPWGVSNHLEVDVAPPNPRTGTGFAWKPVSAYLYHTYDANGFFDPTKVGVELLPTDSVAIKAPAGTRAASADVTLTLKTLRGSPLIGPDGKKPETITLTAVPFVKDSFVLKSGKAGSAEPFDKLVDALKPILQRHYKFSESGNIDPPVLTATLKIDGGPIEWAVDGQLLIELVPRK